MLHMLDLTATDLCMTDAPMRISNSPRLVIFRTSQDERGNAVSSVCKPLDQADI
jgi:hypothetical protein